LEALILFLQIILINIVLSGDNAVVIALASKNLPIQLRKKAIWWGAAGAIMLRLLLTVGAVYFMKIPYIQAVGAILLVYIAIKLLMEEKEEVIKTEVFSFTAVVWTIIVADFVMSLDNVLAVAAVAKGNIPMLFLGIVMSIPLIIWGSTMIVRLLESYPILVFLGAAILGYTAGEMFVNEEKVQEIFAAAHSSFRWFIPLFFTAVVILSGLMRLGFRSNSYKE
jgi:YjbE family integral membrane protein